MRISSEMSYQMDGVNIDSSELAKRKWGFSGIALRTPLKPIFTKQQQTSVDQGENDDDEEEATTPTSQNSRIISSRMLTCPPAPKKRKSSSSKIDQFNNVRRRMDFFNVPDLETVFIRRVDKA